MSMRSIDPRRLDQARRLLRNCRQIDQHPHPPFGHLLPQAGEGEIGRGKPQLPLFSATATVIVMASARVAASERKPSKFASASSNQISASRARGEKALSVMATTGTSARAA